MNKIVTPLRSIFSRYYIPQSLDFLDCQRPIKIKGDLIPCGFCFRCVTKRRRFSKLEDKK